MAGGEGCAETAGAGEEEGIAVGADPVSSGAGPAEAGRCAGESSSSAAVLPSEMLFASSLHGPFGYLAKYSVARAGGSAAIEWRAAEPLWLTLGVGPSVVLRPFDVTSASGRTAFEGVFLGAAVGILFEQRAPVHVKALQTNGNGAP